MDGRAPRRGSITVDVMQGRAGGGVSASKFLDSGMVMPHRAKTAPPSPAKASSSAWTSLVRQATSRAESGLTFDEFSDMVRARDASARSEDLRALFDRFDIDGDGKVYAKDWHKEYRALTKVDPQTPVHALSWTPLLRHSQ